MNKKRSRSTRSTAMVRVIGVLSAVVLAACSSTADLSTAPLSLNRIVGNNTDLDPTGFVRICKSGGPAGTYTFDTSVQGGGAHVINFGSGPQLTLDFTGAEVCLNSYLQLGNDPSWTPGMTANVTLTELPTEGLEVAEIQVWDFTNFPQVLLQTVTGSASVTVTVNATKRLKVLYFNRELPPPPPPSTNCYAITAIQGVAITPVQLTGSGGSGGPYTFSATGLPAGLTLTSAGVLSGTPTVSGNFSYTVTVTDKDGNTGSGGTCAVTILPPPPPPGGEGCTPGYWKQSQHFDSWVPTGLVPNQLISSVFANASIHSLGGNTLVQGLGFNGGSGVVGAARILLRAAIAAQLNARHSNVGAPLAAAAMVTAVNAALASGSRETILALATQLDNNNNLGCALS